MSTTNPIQKTSLTGLHDALSPKMSAMETTLKGQLDTVNDGGDLSTADLLRLQYNISRFTVTSTVMSAILKEIGDSLKGVAAKIN